MTELLSTNPVLVIVAAILFIVLLALAFSRRDEIVLGPIKLTPRSADEPTARAQWRFPESLDDSMLKELLLRNAGRFMWSWAGENWEGWLIFHSTKDGGIEVEMNMKKIKKVWPQEGQEPKAYDRDGKVITGGTVIETLPGGRGRAWVDNGCVKVSNLRTKRYRFKEDSIDEVIEESTGPLEMVLVPTLAFRGDIWYGFDDGTKKKGSISIIKTA